MLTVTGVPETITRSRLVDWLASVGLEASLVRELTVGRRGITAVVYATNEHGARYVAPNGTEAATHTVSIRIEEDVPCPDRLSHVCSRAHPE